MTSQPSWLEPAPGVELTPSTTAALTAATAVLAAAAAAIAVGWSPMYGVVLIGGVAALAVVAVRPVAGVYLFLFATPVIVGINRGFIVPLLRPSEALLVAVCAVVAVRMVAAFTRGEQIELQPTRLDVALVVVVVLGSVFSLAWMAARGIRPDGDDILHGLVFWKYLALYFLVRLVVRSSKQVGMALWLILAANALVAVVAILQSLRAFGVDQLMATYYPPLDQPQAALNARGSATLGHSIAVGDVMAISLALSAGMVINRLGRRSILIGLISLFALGGIASGQFSGFIALMVAILAVGLVTRRLAHVYMIGVPSLIISALLLAPVVGVRLAGFGANEAGVPISWTGRLDNLERYVWPRLFSDYHWIFGVRTSPRIAAWESWRTWVFIESGHSWLLWVGGVPLLLAFFWFCWVAARHVSRVARSRTDAVGVAAIGAATAVAVVFVLTALDAHLTVRGTADLLFPLLALALVDATTGTTTRSRRRATGTAPLPEGGRRVR